MAKIPHRFTPKEMQILSLIAQEKTTGEIAQITGCPKVIIHVYYRRIIRKLAEMIRRLKDPV